MDAANGWRGKGPAGSGLGRTGVARRTRAPRVKADRRAGIVLISIAVVTTGMLALVAASITRSMNDLAPAERATSRTQAFHLAEGGLDRKLHEALTSDFTPIAKTSLGAGQYDVAFAETPPGSGLWRATATGWAGGTAQRVGATIRMPPPTAFDYVVTATGLDLSGNAQVGDRLNRVKLFIDATTQPYSQGNVRASGSNDVWTDRFEFYNPSNINLNNLCSACSNQSVFHAASTQFDTAARQPDPVQIALMPYYQRALQEQAQDGQNYHHITAKWQQTHLTETGNPYTGVIYVECGAHVVFDGNILMHNAVIVHEGCEGQVVLEGNGTSLTMTQDDQAFAKGMAIVGNPELHFKNADVNITGFVMAGGKAAAGGTSLLSVDGTIEGGVIAVASSTPTGVLDVPGPPTADAITWNLGKVEIGGNANLLFKPLTGQVPGVPVDADDVPSIRVWQAE